MEEKNINIENFADAINCILLVRRIPNQKNRWMARFANAETKTHKHDGILSSEYGDGTSPDEAISDYCKIIKGKILIIDSGFRKNRKVFKIPRNLSYKEKYLFANVYEQGEPREMAVPVKESERSLFIRRENNISDETPLYLATKEINFFASEQEAKEEYWSRCR